MKTLDTIITETAQESFPGCTFAQEIKTNAVGILEETVRKTALKALRKAILGQRPKVVNTPKSSGSSGTATAPGSSSPGSRLSGGVAPVVVGKP